MPIQTLDLIYQGVTDFPEVDFAGTFDLEYTNDNPGTGGFWIVGYTYAAADSFVTNNGLISVYLSAQGNGDAVLLNNSTGTIGGGSPFEDGDVTGTITMSGSGTHLIANLGTMITNIQLGSGQDGIYNLSLLDGDVRMGGGDDYFVNDSSTVIAGGLTGVVTGTVNMGSGNDVVLNASQMGRVNLGSGDDSYAAIHPGDVGNNFNNADAIADRVSGGSGNDTMYGGAGDDRFYGNDDDDVLNGHNGDDKLTGGNGNDRINGGNDNDTLYGNQGEDLLNGGNQNDKLYGGDGHDRVNGGNHDDILYGGQGNDTLNGGNHDDVLFGGDSKDTLNGGRGDDTLDGGNGEDLLTGGAGNDVMTGGSGADCFVFTGNSDADVITDFDVGADKVRLQMGGEIFEDFYFGAYGDADVLSFITYADGNAVLDLSGLYQSILGENDFSDANGISVTFLNVAEDSLTGDNFVTPEDYYPPFDLVLG